MSSSGFEPINLTWENINVFAPQPEEDSPADGLVSDTSAQVTNSNKQKQILTNVYGCAEPGTLLAIIGASGAGKTTLLNVLNGRNLGNLKVEGSIKVNGRVPGKGLASVSAYVQQEDLFIHTMTVREHLYVQAMLRMDSTYTEREKKGRIEEIIVDMSLTDCADTMIGYPGALGGISGGERKRLAFACAIIMNPALMCCDEPTTGVDTFVAQSVVSTLRKMAAQGRTILCTIHQPSSEVFAMFDRVLIMAEGRCAFLGSTKEAFTFFTDCGYLCPVNFNPADHFIHTLAVVPGKETECKQRVQEIADKYDYSDHALKVDDTIANIRDNVKFDEATQGSTDGVLGDSPYKVSFYDQLRTIFWRSSKGQFRDRGVLAMRFIPCVGIALFISALYWDQPHDQQGVQNINGAIFLVVIQVSFILIGSVVMTFPIEYPIFLKEHYDGMYRVDVYYWSKTSAELPQQIAVPIIYLVPVYWCVGMNSEAEAFLIALLTCLIITQVSCSFGFFISSLSTNISFNIAVMIIMIIPFMIIGGFMLDEDSIPAYMIWMKYMSWLSFSNEIMIVANWKGVTNITCENENKDSCYHTGEDIIKDLGYSEDSVGFNIGMLLLLMVVYRVIGLMIFFARAYRKHIVPNDDTDETTAQRRRTTRLENKRQSIVSRGTSQLLRSISNGSAKLMRSISSDSPAQPHDHHQPRTSMQEDHHAVSNGYHNTALS